MNSKALCDIAPYAMLPPNMSHAAKNKEKLIVRARRIRGQVEALVRAGRTAPDGDRLTY